MQWKESASPTANKSAVTKSQIYAYLSLLLHHDPVSFAFITQRQTVNQDSYVDVLPGIKANLRVGISEFRLSNLFFQHDWALIYWTFSVKLFTAK